MVVELLSELAKAKEMDSEDYLDIVYSIVMQLEGLKIKCSDLVNVKYQTEFNKTLAVLFSRMFPNEYIIFKDMGCYFRGEYFVNFFMLLFEIGRKEEFFNITDIKTIEYTKKVNNIIATQ